MRNEEIIFVLANHTMVQTLQFGIVLSCNVIVYKILNLVTLVLGKIVFLKSINPSNAFPIVYKILNLVTQVLGKIVFLYSINPSFAFPFDQKSQHR